MTISAVEPDTRVVNVTFEEDAFTVSLMDGRKISAPLAWYPRLSNASSATLNNWEICGGGFGIHWPDLDEDISSEGLLRGAPSVEIRPASAA